MSTGRAGTAGATGEPGIAWTARSPACYNGSRRVVRAREPGGGPYRDKPAAQSFTLFVERIEEGIMKERAETIQMRTAHDSDQERASTPSMPRAVDPEAV